MTVPSFREVNQITSSREKKKSESKNVQPQKFDVILTVHLR